ncbi:DUF4157 domain-containing protein [Humitalea sp. 24SJ18S-53]|uniref:eCIS core domain-containing protein n=1 Tax=Humitalea sp. 24SJ18S-53 TaxID=3422307 RepID=UPI003D67DF0F
MSAALLQRACACGKKDERKLLRRAQAGAATSGFAPPIVHAVLRDAGTVLDERSRPLAERILGPDFPQVRIHTDSRAADSATAVGALAYTVGPHIVFGPGRFAPGTAEGDHLLAHELAHVAQQGAAPVPASLAIGAPDSAFEAQAERVATQVQAAPRAAAPAMLMRASCEGRTVRNCAGTPCTAASGRGGVCQWGGITYGCRCRDQSGDAPTPNRVMELLPGWLLAILSAAAIAAIIACFATGVCEAAALIGACGAAAAAVVIAILRDNGVTVNEA